MQHADVDAQVLPPPGGQGCVDTGGLLEAEDGAGQAADPVDVLLEENERERIGS